MAFGYLFANSMIIAPRLAQDCADTTQNKKAQHLLGSRVKWIAYCLSLRRPRSPRSPPKTQRAHSGKMGTGVAADPAPPPVPP